MLFLPTPSSIRFCHPPILKLFTSAETMQSYRMLKSSVLPSLLLLGLLICFPLPSNGRKQGRHGTADGSEEWGYVRVRPKAYMFWWLYKSPQRVDNGSTPWPTVLWLQGGPGGSGVGVGNFQEIGPLDTNLQPRNSTWLQKADLLFVDNPVGTGYSFVKDGGTFVKTDWEAATDLTTLLKKLYNNNERLQKSPLYIVAESYGGKYAVTLAISIIEALITAELKLNLGGVVLGDSWISGEDYVFSWGPLLRDLSRLDISAAEGSNRIAETIKQQLEKRQYENATNSWSELESFISSKSNFVDFYNFLEEDGPGSNSMMDLESSDMIAMKKYSSYLSIKTSTTGSFSDLMNVVIRKKLKIIPKDVRFGGQSDLVFSNLAGDFMKPRIDEVDQLLFSGVNVTVYNGQVDLICATKGTEAWVQKLTWDGLQKFTNSDRTPLYCGEGGTKAFVKSYQNFNFYWILGAGHFVPVDQPCIALKMLGDITQSPAADNSDSS